MVDITTCPACGKERLTPRFFCEDYTVSHETFQIKQCESCDLGVTTPRPEDNNLDKYYLSNNYISHSGKAQTPIDKIYLLARRFTLSRKLKLINRLNQQPGNILDYGCGTGEFLLTCKKAHWTIDGIEPSDSARKKASELLSLEISNDVEKTSSKYDVITLWHVLEHVPDLSSTLKKLSSKLKPNGTILVAVPNYQSYDGEYYKRFWAGYDVPRHLWHFTRKSMEALLQKNSLHLITVMPMKLDSFYVSLLSEQYKRNNQSLTGMIRAFAIGTFSNLKGRKNNNYSSLIYIIKK